MTTPDYVAFLARISGDTQHADAMNHAGALLSGRMPGAMFTRSGGDFDGLNDLIDAQLDTYLATCDGDMRLALFGVLAMYGQAMYALAGPPGSGAPR